MFQAEGQLSVARVRYDTLIAEGEDRLQLMIQTVEKLELEKTEMRNRLDEEKRCVYESIYVCSLLLYTCPLPLLNRWNCSLI